MNAPISTLVAVALLGTVIAMSRPAPAPATPAAQHGTGVQDPRRQTAPGREGFAPVRRPVALARGERS